MGQEAIAETLPSWIGFLGSPYSKPKLNGRLACQQMLCSGISVSLLGYKSPFPQDKRWEKKTTGGGKGCSGEMRMREACIVRYSMCSDVGNRILGIVCQLVFWPSEHISLALSSLGIPSVAVQYIKVLREIWCFTLTRRHTAAARRRFDPFPVKSKDDMMH